jgi:methylated-DNA-[protein]-cysteine S-methyltransferase
MTLQPVRYTVVNGPIGDLLLTSDGASLTGLYLEAHKGGPVSGPGWTRDDDGLVMRDAAAQLAAYFAGDREEFTLGLVLRGTEFQRTVWNALRAIPFGTTVSYAELARRVGAPEAVRAVGAAVGRNPLSIIVPCHRVVGSNGKLTGYAGGLDRKRWLLTHEGAAGFLQGIAS